MLKILEEVIAQRQLRNDENTTIQLSSTFMRRAVEEVNAMTGKDDVVYNPNLTEFKFKLLGKEYKVINRAYRDDTNDKDVEEVVIGFILCQ